MSNFKPFLAGFGKLYYKDGSFYVGEFENGEKNGFGKMVFSVTDDRDSFEGKKMGSVRYSFCPRQAFPV